MRRLQFLILLIACLAASVAPSLAAAQIAPRDEVAPSILADEDPVVVRLEVQGLTAYDPVQVAARLGLVVGQPIPPAPSITAAQRALWDDFRLLVARGGIGYEEVEGGVVCHLAFEESPVDLDPTFVGNVHFDTETLREWALLDDRVEVYSSEAANIAERIREAYRRQGYHFVEVEPRIGGTGVRYREVIFEIREGPKVYVTSVKIEGNESIASEGVLLWRTGLDKEAKLGTKGRGLFAWWGHRYVEEVIASDLLAMSQVYRQRGFLDAVISHRVEFSEDRAGAKVTFLVDEGPQYKVGSVRIQAVEGVLVPELPGGRNTVEYRDAELVFPEDELMELLSLREGEAFEQIRVQLDRRALMQHYGREGYVEASLFQGNDGTKGLRFLEEERRFDYENRLVHVTYRLQQGQPYYLRFLEIEGNSNTKDRVIRRRFAQLEGEKVDPTKLADGLRRVRATGFFDDPYARGAHPPPTFRYVPVENEPDLVDVFVAVEEGRTINANLSGGVASDQGLIGIISLQIQNFDLQRLPRSFAGTFGEVYRKEAFIGDGETFGVDLSPGSEVSYWRVFYSHPDIFGRHFDPYGYLVELQSRDRIFRSHDEGRRFVRMSVSRAFAQGDVQASLGIRAQEIETSDISTSPVPQTLTNSVGDEQFIGLTAGISANDLDNPRLPRSGTSVQWSNTFYTEAFGSDNNLWKSELSFDRYFHFSDDLQTAAPGVYLGFGAGLAVPVDGSKGSVNYGERFFFGGSRFGRGFRFRGVGPFEGDFPIGGESFLRSTLEYRFPLYTQAIPGTARERELFRGSLFVDAGLLDPQAYELDLEETRVSAGFALGLIDPFPVTFSFGWPLREGDGDLTQVFAFSLTLR